ncbi:MAG: MarR family transcriptional regulator [Acidimicrobiia bacterium]|nr:MarR family transcriptional regulator [Acidimicrobiia bacterium]MCL4292555.1 MarR family transcriptional regulator [Acidimicrobiia bacterium]
MRAWRSFMTGHARIAATLDRELQDERGLSLSSYEVLVHLSEAPDRRLRMNELAGKASLSRSGLTRLVDRLQADGLVDRQGCPEDRRGSYAELTSAGERVLEEAWPVHVRGVREHFVGRLSADEITVLGAALRRLADAD